jgi:hypothetical protein
MTSKPNSIDLIEECLDQIYKCRKSALLARARKFKEKEDRIRSSNNGIGGNARHQFVRETTNYEYDDVDDDLIDDNEQLKELSVKFSAPPPKPLSNRTSTPYTKADLNQFDSAPPDECDLIAESAFAEFSLEITTWLNNHSKDVVGDDDIRSEFADQMVHSYLSSNLDRLPSSKRVTEIRKLIANTIEDFVSSGAIKLNITSLKQTNNMTRTLSQGTIPTVTNTQSAAQTSNSGNGKNKVTFVAPNNTQNNNTNGSKSTQPAVTVVETPSTAPVIQKVKPAADDKTLEKKKIKAQYEQFMNMKKKTDTHPDNETLQQYTDLNDDIQSLLSSLQKK